MDLRLVSQLACWPSYNAYSKTEEGKLANQLTGQLANKRL